MASPKNSTTKKISKHSKKFERTQTGCLQCRQKKKKCDGKRPTCYSCEKKGISCDFPANIRIFQVHPETGYSSSGKKTIRQRSTIGTSSKPVSFKHVCLDESIGQNVLIPQNFKESQIHMKKEDKISLEIPQNLENSNLSKNFDQFFELDKTSSRASSISSSFSEQGSGSRSDSISTLISDSDSDSITGHSQILTQPSTPPSGLGIGSDGSLSTYKMSDAQRATNLVHDGESITKILNDMSIDLIKKSINNLQYINFDEKIITNGFRFPNERNQLSCSFGAVGKDINIGSSNGQVGNLVTSGNDNDVCFHPEEFLSFD